MAGGEGTRLRPLTSNQPKPMVPIVGKPCMEHILDLLREHGFDDVIVTLAFMPQAIRGYFGDGEAYGVSIRYSVEESPAGTAGSVKLAEEALDETFLVISGDALCDIDLGALVRFHKEKGAMVTIGLKSVPNPLEFGIVVTDEDGRIERFLEKPSWGQVFTDTINTGIYVLEPEVLRHVPTDTPYDFSKELFPLLLEMGKPLYGFVCDGYWQDIGNLDQYRQANFDALDERVRLTSRASACAETSGWGRASALDDLESVEAPAFIGNYCRIAPRASVGPYSVLMPSVTLGDHARTARSVIDASTSSAAARSSRARSSAGPATSARTRASTRASPSATTARSARRASSCPGVRIYPFKEVESGAIVDRNLIWESRLSSRLIGLGRRLGPDQRRPHARDRPAPRPGARHCARPRRPRGHEPRRLGLVPPPPARAHRRRQLGGRPRRRPPGDAGGRQPALPEDGGLRRRHPRPAEPERPRGASQIRIFEPPGTPASPALVKEIDKHFSRQEFRRASWNEVGEITLLGADRGDLRPGPARHARRRGDPRRAASASSSTTRFSAASLVLPQVLGALDVEAVASHAYVSERRHAARRRRSPSRSGRRSGSSRRSAPTSASCSTRPPSGSSSSTTKAREVPVEQELLLFLRLLASDGKRGRLALPDHGHEPRRRARRRAPSSRSSARRTRSRR